MDSIRISELELSCIVGIRPSERRRRQRVRLAIELDLDLSRSGTSGRIAQTVDYSVVVDEAAKLLEFREYRLIEMATEELSAMLLGIYPTVERVRITLEKPEALRGRARAAVSIERKRSEARVEALAFGEEHVLLENAEARLSVLKVKPGSRIERLSGPERRLGWLFAGALEGAPPVAPHDPRELERVLGAPNPGPGDASLFLCCCAPHP
jgi:FolB domain-containing protein